MKKVLFLISLLSVSAHLWAQPQVLDEIVAVVGSEIILNSDIQLQKNQLKAQNYQGEISDCQVLEEILFEKLLLNQAKVDSLEVTDDMVNTQLDKRLNVFVRQIGSQEALEEYYGKSIEEIREEFFDVLKDQILVQRMESEINKDLNVTPDDIQDFFNSIPQDSVPFVNASVEMAQIVIYPEPSVEQREKVRNKLREFKDEVESGGEDFETLAALYSDDPGSAAKGGNLGMKPRGTWVPEFDAVAFNLKDGQVSVPFETDYGFHIMQMLERRGEMYDANHILLIPEITSVQLTQAQHELDSIRNLVVRDSISFALAAGRYSSDEKSKNQNGMMVNPATSGTVFEMDELDPTVFLAIDTLEMGEITQPFYFQGQGREKGYRIIKLINRTEPHRANLNSDYQMMQNMATERLRAQAVDSWVRHKIDNTYIKLVEEFPTCNFGYPWAKNQNSENN